MEYEKEFIDFLTETTLKNILSSSMDNQDISEIENGKFKINTKINFEMCEHDTKKMYMVWKTGREIDAIEYNPNHDIKPLSCVDVYINDVLYYVPIDDYDEAIREGRTKFIIHRNHVKMITPEQYELLELVMKKIPKNGDGKKSI